MNLIAVSFPLHSRRACLRVSIILPYRTRARHLRLPFSSRGSLIGRTASVGDRTGTSATLDIHNPTRLSAAPPSSSSTEAVAHCCATGQTTTRGVYQVGQRNWASGSRTLRWARCRGFSAGREYHERGPYELSERQMSFGTAQSNGRYTCS